MPVDTRDKRASVLGLAVATFALVLPNPDGAALTQADRQQTAFSYAGIAAAVSNPLSICKTRAVSLMPAKTVRSLMPSRTVASICT